MKHLANPLKNVYNALELIFLCPTSKVALKTQWIDLKKKRNAKWSVSLTAIIFHWLNTVLKQLLRAQNLRENFLHKNHLKIWELMQDTNRYLGKIKSYKVSRGFYQSSFLLTTDQTNSSHYIENQREQKQFSENYMLPSVQIDARTRQPK